MGRDFGHKAKRKKAHKWQHFDEEMTSVLYGAFNQNPWPDIAVKKHLSEQLGIKVKGVSSWFERTRFKQGVRKIGSETFTNNNFPPFPNVKTRCTRSSCFASKFQGVDLHLLESVFKQDPKPDPIWLVKIAEFTQQECKDVADWFTKKSKEINIVYE